MPDHVHMLISIPPKHPVSQILGTYERKELNMNSAQYCEQAA